MCVCAIVVCVCAQTVREREKNTFLTCIIYNLRYPLLTRNNLILFALFVILEGQLLVQIVVRALLLLGGRTTNWVGVGFCFIYGFGF